MNKKKIINDPVYGFVTLPYEIIFDLIEHPYFQRLRHIQQLGLTSYVYPGALHTRFHHAIGATHLMTQAIKVLRSKGVVITKKEAKAVTIAILMHDIGHGPFSHALEYSLVANVHHEELSILFMEQLNEQFKGKLSLAIEIFKGDYEKHFLHELVSSQLDLDRLDYLKRDSFFTGVQEGVIGSERIIKMLNERENHLVVEHKGIYSIEKFIIARRLMYWQVYLHKTVLVAEIMLLKVLERAKELVRQGIDVFAPPYFRFFLEKDYHLDDFKNNESILQQFAQLGDADIFTSIKVWQQHEDTVLSELSKRIVNRKLLKIRLSNRAFSNKRFEELTQKAMQIYQISEHEASYLVFKDKIYNSAYTYEGTQINILHKNGKVQNILNASDLNLDSLTKPVVKHYMCYPKEVV